MESIDITNAALLLGAALAVLGILSSLVAQRFGAPLLLIFLVIGMLAGEDGPGHLQFSDYKLTYLIGSFALAVILFDGGLRTKIGHLRGAVLPAVTLATLGVIITAGLTGWVAAYLFELPTLEGLLLGAVVSSTDAAAVFFLIHAGGLQLRQRVGATLEMESATNDPVAVFLTMVLVQLVVATGAGVAHGPAHIAEFLALHVVFGTIGGVAGGFLCSWLLNRVELPGGLHPLMVIALAVLIYGLTAIVEGSGFLAVYLAGMIMGNRPLRAQASIVTVNDAATWLSQIVMFMVLGLLVTPSKLLATALPACAVAAFLLVFGRPIAVWLCLTPFGFSAKEKWLVSWVGLRGAVSIFLAAIPTLSGVPHAELYFNIAFVVVLLSLLIQGWTLTWAARKLDLALPRTAAAVHRQEVDLPGQLALEMVGYRVRPESAVMNGAALPAWARPAFVVRNEQVISATQAGALQGGDYAYFLAPPDRAAHLDQMFAPHAELLTSNEPFFGEFAFDGAIRLKDLETFYGLTVIDHDPMLTVAGLFALKFESKPEVGDHLPLGRAVLVVREVRDDQVHRAGLQLDVQSDDPVLGWFARMKRKFGKRPA